MGFIEGSTRIIVIDNLRPDDTSMGSRIYELSLTVGFDDVDAAVTWHLVDSMRTRQHLFLAYTQVYFTFRGVAAHADAAAAPHLGRSALDELELMNIGVNFLREHMADSARIHYAITDGGGESPNVVQARPPPTTSCVPRPSPACGNCMRGW